jgi:hypothetical protein
LSNRRAEIRENQTGFDKVCQGRRTKYSDKLERINQILDIDRRKNTEDQEMDSKS